METKKLTCSALMVGDYMKYKDGTIVQIARVGDISPMDAPIYCRTQLEGYFPCQFDDISPIPLTTEILEKLGFERQEEERGFSEPYCVYVNDDFPYVIKVYPKDLMDSYSRLEIGYYDDNEHMSLLINYLHELQHALRLCKVDKEIVL